MQEMRNHSSRRPETGRRWYFAVALGALIAAFAFLAVSLLQKDTEEGVLEASAEIRGTEITLSSKVPGTVERLRVTVGQAIKEGELVALISSEQIEARLAQVKAERENAFHTVHQARAARQKIEAEITEAAAQKNLAENDFKRYSTLLKEGAVAVREFERAETVFKATKAKLDALREAKEEALAALEKAEAASLVVKAKEEEVEATLNDTRIVAPSRGTVINKLTEEGELVAAGTPIVTLVDLSDIYAKVYIREKDIGRIRLGNPARIFSDAFPDRPFEGAVAEISQKAEFTPREIHMKEERTKLVFAVKVKIENPQGYLKPGMPVDVKIKWRDDVPW
jgi:HlyD family secretion protein